MKISKLLLLGLLICTTLFGCARKSYLDSVDSDNSADLQDEEAYLEEDLDTDSPILESNNIYIQLSGAVANPGVYEVACDSRLFQVVELAGGLREDAAADSLNQAQIVSDGQNIYVPTVKEAEKLKELEASDVASAIIDGRVNINTADETELMTLPGVGQSKAKLIIEYRETNGSYNAIEDIMNIQGIKEGIFNKIKDQITVGY